MGTTGSGIAGAVDTVPAGGVATDAGFAGAAGVTFGDLPAGVVRGVAAGFAAVASVRAAANARRESMRRNIARGRRRNARERGFAALLMNRRQPGVSASRRSKGIRRRRETERSVDPHRRVAHADVE